MRLLSRIWSTTVTGESVVLRFLLGCIGVNIGRRDFWTNVVLFNCIVDVFIKVKSNA
jgi:hypothetical protein